MMSNYVRLSSRVSSPAEEAEEDGAPARGLQTYIIALDCEGVWFIECDPVLHPVTKLLKACLGVMGKVLSVKMAKVSTGKISKIENIILSINGHQRVT